MEQDKTDDMIERIDIILKENDIDVDPLLKLKISLAMIRFADQEVSSFSKEAMQRLTTKKMKDEN
jgi:hypothetical protein